MDKLATLKQSLSDMKSVLVAHSGGVDSTFLLKVAQAEYADDRSDHRSGARAAKEHRVRHPDTIARIEVDPRDFEEPVRSPLRERVIEKIQAVGYPYVALDLLGTRTGSLNEGLKKP